MWKERKGRGREGEVFILTEKEKTNTEKPQKVGGDVMREQGEKWGAMQNVCEITFSCSPPYMIMININSNKHDNTKEREKAQS